MTDHPVELPEFVETEEGSSLYYKNKWLYSRHKPVSRAIALTAALPIQEECLYIVYSPCLWYGIPELLARLPATSAILALEHDPALYKLAQDNLPHTIKDAMEQKRLALMPYGLEANVFDIVSRLGRFRRVQEVILSSGWTLAPVWYKAFPQKLLQHFSDYYRSRLTLMRMGMLWIRNTLKNILALPPVPAQIPQSLKPVLVCGAGLSLYNALPFIKQSRKDFFILACDTAFGTLKDAGITPDSIVCLDAQIYNMKDLIGYKETGILPHAFLDISAHPSFYKNIFTSVTPVITQWAQTALLTRLLNLPYNFITLPPYGSVGITALALAAKIAQKEIWITGLDFAFTGGWTHAPGTHIDQHELAHESRLYKRTQSWSMSFREGTTAVNLFLRTEPALEMYHASCKTLLEQYKNEFIIIDIRSTHGLELGLTKIELNEINDKLFLDSSNSENFTQSGNNKPVCTSFIDTQEAHNPISNSHTVSNSQALSSDAVAENSVIIFKDFIVREYQAIQELREILITGTEPSILTQKLLELDYLFIHFPDYERVTALGLDFLKRVALACEYWMFYLAKICPECKRS